MTRRQTAQNNAFLKALARTGNARLAARLLGVHRSTFTKRRARHPAFAAQWQAALQTAHAALERGTTPNPPLDFEGRGTTRRVVEGPPSCPDPGSPTKTHSAEPTITRLATGRLQLRQAGPGRTTVAARRTFLEAVEEGADLRAAAAAGFAHSSFLARARRDPAVARALRIGQAIGKDRRVWAGVERILNPREDLEPRAPIGMPRMTVDQAMQQLIFHRPDGPFQRALRPVRRPKLAEVLPGIAAKAKAIKRHAHYKRTGSWRYPEEEVATTMEEKPAEG